MPNPLYNSLFSEPKTMTPAFNFQTPMQRMSYLMQAMNNPAQFVRQYLPGIPEHAYQDPSGNGVLQYMISNMGVTQQDISNAAMRMPSNFKNSF